MSLLAFFVFMTLALLLTMAGLIGLAVGKFFDHRNMQEKRWEKEDLDFNAEYKASYGFRVRD